MLPKFLQGALRVNLPTTAMYLQQPFWREIPLFLLCWTFTPTTGQMSRWANNILMFSMLGKNSSRQHFQKKKKNSSFFQKKGFDISWESSPFLLLYDISPNLSPEPASVAQLDAPSDWRPGGRGFNPRRGRQHSFVEIDREMFSFRWFKKGSCQFLAIECAQYWLNA